MAYNGTGPPSVTSLGNHDDDQPVGMRQPGPSTGGQTNFGAALNKIIDNSNATNADADPTMTLR
ncbi:MAG: hypothetical protein R3D80_21485 [Paracoccaceae bacterium]